MKKLSLIPLMLIFSHVCQAHQPFTGFNLGGAIGGILLDMDVEQHINGNFPDLFMLQFPSDLTTQARGPAAWLGVGYSHLFSNQIILGAELTAGWDHVMISDNDEASLNGNLVYGTLESQLRNDFAVLAKLGYLIKHHTHVYALIGPRWGNFESTLEITLPSSSMLTESNSGYELGYTVGVGMEHLLTQQLSLGLEYAYTHYGELDPLTVSTSLISFVPVNLTQDAEMNANTNTLAFKLTYHF